jgi:hypothetical protein
MAAVPLPPSVARTALIALRASFGVPGWLAPLRTATLFGLDTTDPGALAYMIRLFAVRDTALGALLATSSVEQRALHLKVGVAVDTADTAAALIALLSRKVPLRAGLLASLASGAAAGLGVAALAGERPAG